ncbi:unnamed protein product, partial [Adineta steineri]
MQVKDEELRKKLTPPFDFGCKRALVTNDWYPAIQKPNVKLVTNRIKEIKSDSIVTYDGDEYPVDIIIWSTGYMVQTFPMPAYRGVTVPNFPNFFVLVGPNTGLGHNSIIVMIEAQIQYITQALLYMNENNAQSLDVKQDVNDRYNDNIQSKLKKTVWQSGGCRSWYQNANIYLEETEIYIFTDQCIFIYVLTKTSFK